MDCATATATAAAAVGGAVGTAAAAVAALAAAFPRLPAVPAFGQPPVSAACPVFSGTLPSLWQRTSGLAPPPHFLEGSAPSVSAAFASAYSSLKFCCCLGLLPFVAFFGAVVASFGAGGHQTINLGHQTSPPSPTTHLFFFPTIHLFLPTIHLRFFPTIHLFFLANPTPPPPSSGLASQATLSPSHLFSGYLPHFLLLFATLSLVVGSHFCSFLVGVASCSLGKKKRMTSSLALPFSRLSSPFQGFELLFSKLGCKPFSRFFEMPFTRPNKS